MGTMWMTGYTRKPSSYTGTQRRIPTGHERQVMRNGSPKSRHRRAVRQPEAAMSRLNSGYSGEEPINEDAPKTP
jgi:hypothetical protein